MFDALFDERFKLHRYKSTSHAAVVGGVALGACFLWQYYGDGVVRGDILLIMSLMALTKIAALLFYRLTD